MDTSIKDYNLQHNLKYMDIHTIQYKNNNTKFKHQLEVEFDTTSRYVCIYINIFKS